MERLTGEAGLANHGLVHEFAVAETCGTVVNGGLLRKRQLWPARRVRKEEKKQAGKKTLRRADTIVNVPSQMRSLLKKRDVLTFQHTRVNHNAPLLCLAHAIHKGYVGGQLSRSRQTQNPRRQFAVGDDLQAIDVAERL